MGMVLLEIILVLTLSMYEETYGLSMFDLLPFVSPQTNNSLQVDSLGKAYVL